ERSRVAGWRIQRSHPAGGSCGGGCATALPEVGCCDGPPLLLLPHQYAFRRSTAYEMHTSFQMARPALRPFVICEDVGTVNDGARLLFGSRAPSLSGGATKVVVAVYFESGVRPSIKASPISLVRAWYWSWSSSRASKPGVCSPARCRWAIAKCWAT